MKTVVISRLIGTLFLCNISLLTTEAQNISGVINSYHRVTAINTGTNTISLDNAGGLSVGSRVLMIQMKGATIDGSNTATFGDINPASNLGNAGNYEFNVICAIAGNDVVLSRPLLRNYTVAGSVQIVSIPFYNVVTVTSTLSASPWNSTTGTGGVLVMEADTIILNSNIDVSGQGFAGGALLNYPRPPYDCSYFVPVNDFFLPLMPPINTTPYQLSNAAPKGEGIADFITNAEYARGKQANGGGGGNNHNAGGGGGSNYGAGGLGGAKSLETGFLCRGPNPGVGGLGLSGFGYSIGNNRIFLGGGGGAGHQNNDVGMAGAAGGGIVILTANVIVGSGRSILADGARPINPALVIDPLSAGGDGGGGGGGGGVVILNINSVSGNITASASGGRGSDAARTGTNTDCPGSGGGGGGGLVWMKGAVPVANVTRYAAGGASGMGSPNSPNVNCRNTTAGAMAGNNGTELLNYARPMGSTPACAPLPINELRSFTGSATEDGNLLLWQMHHVDNIVRFELERTIDQVKYVTVATVNSIGKLSFSATDLEKNVGTVYYRLKVTRSNSHVDYSYLVRINPRQPAEFQWLGMRPNPASQQVNLNLYIKQTSTVKISLYNGSAQPLLQRQIRMQAGYSYIDIPLDKFPKGVYWMVIETNGSRMVKTLIKN